MNKKISLGAVIALMAITAAITVSITYTVAMKVFNQRVYSVAERQNMYNKISEIDQKMRQNYLGTIDEEQLRTVLAEGYVSGIGDEYCRYLTAEEYNAELEEENGISYGIGIEVNKTLEGNILIYSVNENSPAAKAGVKAGDIITRVGSDKVSVMGYSEAVAQLSSVSESKAVFTVRRSGEELSFEITKAKYERVDVSFRAIDKVGYIYIRRFSANTCDQFENAISELIGLGCQGFVFDVRDNSGGQLSSVCEVLDALLPTGSLVRTTDKAGNVTEDYISDAKELAMPMVVIVNEETASAAELFAATLRDRKEVKLVGSQTVGKGTLQKNFPLSDGSAVSITVATFAPPISDSFDKVGLVPDFPVQMTETGGSFHLLDENTDNQLSTAISVLKYSLPEEPTEQTAQ